MLPVRASTGSVSIPTFDMAVSLIIIATIVSPLRVSSFHEWLAANSASLRPQATADFSDQPREIYRLSVEIGASDRDAFVTIRGEGVSRQGDYGYVGRSRL